jgi:hypothetical protein
MNTDSPKKRALLYITARDINDQFDYLLQSIGALDDGAARSSKIKELKDNITIENIEKDMGSLDEEILESIDELEPLELEDDFDADTLPGYSGKESLTNEGFIIKKDNKKGTTDA